MPEMDSGRNNTVPQKMAKYFSPLNTSIDCYDDNLISLDQDFILLTFVCIIFAVIFLSIKHSVLKLELSTTL